MANIWVGLTLVLFIGGLFVSGLLFAFKPNLVAGRGDPLVRSFVLGYSLTFLAMLVVLLASCYIVYSQTG